jgi:disulfide bond formation protein DsbB
MLEKKNTVILIFILFIISASLVGAFFIQYHLGHLPCKLCIYERIPYILSIFLILEMLFLNTNRKNTLLLLSLIFIISSILAFYHFGIEQGLFSESFVCESNNFSEILTKEQILEQLKQNSISCKDVSFKILGLSLASINTIFSIILSVIFIKLFINYGKN